MVCLQVIPRFVIIICLSFLPLRQAQAISMNGGKHLVVLFGQGGLSDVGRHAVAVAVQQCSSVTVLTQHPELLDEPNWNCGCPEPHAFSQEEKAKINLVKVDQWEDTKLTDHFANVDGVVSCIGNRQPTFMSVPASSWCSYEGNQMVISAMNKHNIRRAVVMSSVGIEEDWPPIEFHWAGKALAAIFTLCARRAYRDLSKTERAYRSSALDYLLVRPVGLGEDTVPEGTWVLQKEKYKDPGLDVNIAKLDVARFMVQEALVPTLHENAVVIGSPRKDSDTSS